MPIEVMFFIKKKNKKNMEIMLLYQTRMQIKRIEKKLLHIPWSYSLMSRLFLLLTQQLVVAGVPLISNRKNNFILIQKF